MAQSGHTAADADANVAALHEKASTTIPKHRFCTFGKKIADLFFFNKFHKSQQQTLLQISIKINWIIHFNLFLINSHKSAFLNGPSSASFLLFSNRQNKFYNKLMWTNVH